MDYIIMTPTDHNLITSGKHFSWQTDPPTETGWYWVLWNGETVCSYVFESKDKYYLVNGSKECDVTASLFTHWLGPLPPPEMPK